MSDEVHQLVDEIPALKAVPEPTAFTEPDYVLWGSLAAGLSALIAAVLFFLRRRGHSRELLPPVPSPAEQAVVHLRALAEELPPLGRCGVRISLILRDFLAGETQDPALFETHEEFTRRLDSLSGVPERCRVSTHRLLDELASLKYAQQTDSPTQARRLIDEALALVSAIDAARQEEASNPDSV